MDIKRNSQGVVDAISAEDIGKFPDTNLAESLQRITGVSIDRSNGEGSTVTVRGFGPEYNLVTLNGRQMPTATLGDGASPPASRSFGFANLASEGIAAVEVYKTGRASVPSGGIGSTINIRTPRPFDKPGTRGSLAARAVYDSSRNQGDPVTPEVSGIFSTTFADDRLGVLLPGTYQKRKASANSASVGRARAARQLEHAALPAIRDATDAYCGHTRQPPRLPDVQHAREQQGRSHDGHARHDTASGDGRRHA